MSVIDDMEKFVKMKAAMAMEKAATAQGEAGAGIGMGMGLMMPAMFAQNNAAPAATGRQVQSAESHCPDCQHAIPGDARFCPFCGHQQVIISQCSHCRKNLTPNALFCSKCGQPTDHKPQVVNCPQCRTENMPGAMFCNQCGHKVV